MTEPCTHVLLLSGGRTVFCQLEEGHGQPHQARLANDRAAGAGAEYRAAAVVVWSATKEAAPGG